MKTILRGKAARNAILQGMEELAEAVAATLGPQGRNAVIHIGWGQIPNSTRDGVTVAKAIDLDDPLLNAGAQLLKSVAAKTAEMAGDGTTTATILACYLCRAGIKAIEEGASPVALKREILAAAEKAAAHLRSMARPVFGERIEQVATISANNDPIVGKLIAEAVRAAGSHGIITVEDSPTLETTCESAEGMRLAAGWKTPIFISNQERQEFQYEDCAVAIFEKKLGQLKPGIQEMFQRLAATTRPLLILAEDIEGDVMATLAVNRMQKLIPWCAVKLPPGSSPEFLADIAAITHGKVISDDLGLADHTNPIACVGSAKSVRVTRRETTIIASERSYEVEQRIKAIQRQLDDTQDMIERDRLQERLAKLSGGVAILRVGAASEVELREKKARIEDAIHATRAAIEEGVVPGGGIALFRLACAPYILPKTHGGDILGDALAEPLRRIVENSGESYTTIRGLVADTKDLGHLASWGWNALNGECCDLIEAGVLDPVKVTRTALLNAASLAGIVLLTEVLVIDVQDPVAVQLPS